VTASRYRIPRWSAESLRLIRRNCCDAAGEAVARSLRLPGLGGSTGVVRRWASCDGEWQGSFQPVDEAFHGGDLVLDAGRAAAPDGLLGRAGAFVLAVGRARAAHSSSRRLAPSLGSQSAGVLVRTIRQGRLRAWARMPSAADSADPLMTRCSSPPVISGMTRGRRAVGTVKAGGCARDRAW
jgi:hypothetical protein